MPYFLDVPEVVDIGRNTPATPSAASSVTFSTNKIITAGSKVVCFAGWFDAAATTATGGSVGGVTMIAERQIQSGSAHFAIVSGDTGVDIAAATTVTVNFSAATPDSRFVSGVYVTGLVEGGFVTSQDNTGTTATAWSVGGVSMRRPGVNLGGAYLDGAGSTSTPGANFFELHDFNIAGDSSMATGWRIMATGSANNNGTWSGAGTNWAAVSVNYSSRELFIPSGMPSGV